MTIDTKIPDLLGLDADGNEVRLSDYPGKSFIIYFYPKDSTPGCTAEACSLQDGLSQFDEMGYKIIGVSADSQASHKRFAARYGLNFTLIADTNRDLCRLFGVLKSVVNKKGEEKEKIVRTTFVVGPDHIVTDKIEKVNTREAAAQLFALLDGRDSPNPA